MLLADRRAIVGWDLPLWLPFHQRGTRELRQSRAHHPSLDRGSIAAHRADPVALRSFAFDRLNAIAAVLDDAGTIVDTNAAWRLFTHLNDGTVGTTGAGSNYLDTCDRAAASGSGDAAEVARGLRQILAGERADFDLEYPCPSPSEDRWFLLLASAIPIVGGNGIALFHVDISTRKLRELELADLVEHDDLTGLPNRRAATRFIDEHLVTGAGIDGALSVLYIDLDGFKTINDTYGHHVGDELLAKVAARAHRSVRRGDMLCRLAGDEFLLACPNLSHGQASSIAERLRRVMALPFQVGASEISIGASVGVARSDAHSTVATLLRAADSQMYLDKAPPESTDGEAAGSSETSVLLASLQSAQAKSDAIVARSRDLVMFFENDGTIVWVSPASSELHGWAQDDLVGRNGLEMIHPDDRERVLTDFLSIPNLGDHVRTEFRIIDHDGTVRWLDEIATNMIDDPDVGVIVGNLRDITDRKHAEEAARIRTRLLDAVGQPVIASDRDGAVIYWNEAAQSTYGWTSDEALGTHLGNLLPAADGWDGAVDAIRSQQADSEGWSGEFRLKAKDGTEVPVMVTTTPLFDEDGGRIATIGVSTDLTDRLLGEEVAARLAAIVESSSDAIFSTSLDGIITTWNAGAERMYGRSAAEAIGAHIGFVVTDDHEEEVRDVLARTARGETIPPYETTRRRRDGAEFHASISVSPIWSAAGSITGLAAITRDISDRVELQQRGEDDRRRLAEAQRSANLGSLEWNRHTGEATWSDELYDILGLDHRVPAGERSFTDRIHPDDLGASSAKFEEVLAGDFGDDITYRIVRPDSQIRWIRARYAPVAGRPALVGCTVLDVTERKEASLALEHLAYNDPLTGLPNRLLLSARLDDLLTQATASQERIAVALLDLDQFKHINESLGHAAGDTMLIAVARRLEGVLSPTEMVARFGGDGFAVVQVGLSRDSSTDDLIARLLAAFETPFVIGRRELHMTISIGVIVSRPDDDADAILRDADAAMHAATDSGRARAVTFDDALQIRNRRRLDLETELHTALDRDQLHVVYQPILQLPDLRTAGFEALLRWTHPTLGAVPPDEFIPIAEETGLILPIGEWVREQALQQVAAWRRDSPSNPTWVAVNMSAPQLDRADLVERIAGSLDDADVPADALHLEITESILMDDIDRSLDTIEAIRRLGVKINIDDFGTGYSSLSYLKRLPIDTLKIDRSFINGLGTDPNDTSIVRAIVSLANALNLRVVAEGVETEVQLRALNELGCDYGQGYLWSRGVDAATARRWITPALR